ncbi:MAG: LysE family translocator [Fimbriimonadaceae bacterium]|nr:LysE family translocator [Fimbriimonadaceae bacterium]
MPLQLWLWFVVAAATLLVIPGPTILTLISYAVAHGRRAYLPLLVGIALGDSTALALSLLGLGAVLAASPVLFGVIKWLGGLYLILLGTKLLRAAGKGADQEAIVAPEARWRVAFNIWLITATNPKGIVFMVAFLPQFLSPDHDPRRQLWVMAVTFVSLAIVNATLYTTCAASARRLLASERAQRRFHLIGGTLLSIAGLWALWAHPAGG